MPNEAPTTEQPADAGGRVERAVARTLSELGFLLPSMPIAVLGGSLIVSTFAVGLGTVFTVVGVFVLFGALAAARWFGTVEVARLRLAGRREVPQATRTGDVNGAGVLARLKRGLTDRESWLSLLHGTVINPVVSIFSWTVTVVWLALGLGGATHWLWAPYTSDPARDPELATALASWLQPETVTWIKAAAVDDLLWAAVGALFLLTLPFVTRRLVGLHVLAGRGTIAGSRSAGVAPGPSAESGSASRAPSAAVQHAGQRV
jgi:Putative sensor